MTNSYSFDCFRAFYFIFSSILFEIEACFAAVAVTNADLDVFSVILLDIKYFIKHYCNLVNDY